MSIYAALESLFAEHNRNLRDARHEYARTLNELDALAACPDCHEPANGGRCDTHRPARRPRSWEGQP